MRIMRNKYITNLILNILQNFTLINSKGITKIRNLKCDKIEMFIVSYNMKYEHERMVL